VEHRQRAGGLRQRRELSNAAAKTAEQTATVIATRNPGPPAIAPPTAEPAALPTQKGVMIQPNTSVVVPAGIGGDQPGSQRADGSHPGRQPTASAPPSSRGTNPARTTVITADKTDLQPEFGSAEFDWRYGRRSPRSWSSPYNGRLGVIQETIHGIPTAALIRGAD
jgi:hypothetical protein